MTVQDELHRLLLPIDPNRVDEAAAALALKLPRVDPADLPQLIRNRSSEWKFTGRADSRFAGAIRAAIAEGDPTYGEAIARSYFTVHQKLQQQERLSFDEATATLSHARLTSYLADAGQMSASTIAEILAPLDRRANIHWQAIERVLRGVKLYRELQAADVAALTATDIAAEPSTFGDADVADAAAIVGEVAAELGYPGSAEVALKRLVADDLSMHGPHLRMLYFQCLVAAFADHAVSGIYEFSPRGKVATSLFKNELGDLPGAMNAFLNNAKGVDALDRGWARSRKNRERGSALALVDLLNGLEAMGFGARQELARWLRQWVLRIVVLTKPTLRAVPSPLSNAQIALLVAQVEAAETHTLGIVEQRVLDAMTELLHPQVAGWVQRGQGDAVNASNTSRRKIGDIEHMNGDDRHVVAYESHAGHLSTLYAEGHLLSLAPIIQRRLPDLLSIEPDPAAWRVEVVFVAHSFESLMTPVHLSGVDITATTKTFREISAAAGAVPPSTATKLLADPLNQRGTPQLVRDRVLALLGV